MELTAYRKNWRLREPFVIAYERIDCLETVQVELRAGGRRGRGEAAGVSYHGETAATMLDQIESVRPEIGRGLTGDRLMEILPAGGARNALDCALWDLEAKTSATPAWRLAGLAAPAPCETYFTFGLATPDKLAQMAREAASARRTKLKLKLNGADDIARVEAVRKAAPDADIIVDANESWTFDQLIEFAPALGAMNVKFIEQPLPAGGDGPLLNYRSPVPLCADESCQTTQSLAALMGRYDAACVKLDKTGGLTEALRLVDASRRVGLTLMVGNMCGSSLAMAPAYLLTGHCAVVDLDGPLLNAEDWEDGIVYSGATMAPPRASLWG